MRYLATEKLSLNAGTFRIGQEVPEDIVTKRMILSGLVEMISENEKLGILLTDKSSSVEIRIED